ncbi:MAG: hypothetical protein VX265_02320 [Myxococcota bacterium]|nr:hypothetical protein [Myxococcota bacterium]MEC8424281.1 hypothetical protein [Myxococcota bacterium]
MDLSSAILLPGLFAGAIAIGVTVAVERWGGQIGGLIGTLPSTVVPASIGILATSASASDFQAAMYATPVGMLVNAVFLWTWRALPPRLPGGGLRFRLPLMLAASLFVWAGCATAAHGALTALRASAVPLVFAGVGGTLALGILGAAACLHNPPAPRGRRPVGPLTLLARGVLAAIAIGTAVAIAGLGGALAAGLASTFPAIFLTTMVSLWVSQGEAVQSGAVGPMMLGSASVAMFAAVGAWSLPAFGPTAGSALAWLASALLVTLPAWAWLQRRARRERASR